MLVPSRVSTLTITNPEPSDASTYICSVNGTSEAITLELKVDGMNRNYTTDVSIADNITTNADTTDGQQTTSTTIDTFSNNGTLQLNVIILGSSTAILAGVLVIIVIAMCCLMRHIRTRSTKLNIEARSNLVYDYITVSVFDHNVQPDESITASRMDDITTDTGKDESDPAVERNYDEINDHHEMIRHNLPDHVEHGVTVDSGAYGMTTDGISISEKDVVYGVGTEMNQEENEANYCVATDGIDTVTMERNTAYDVADTIMDNNEAYGAAIDGIGVDTMEKNIAYGAVLNLDDSAGDTECYGGR